jgi:hypothetical protein
MLPKTLLGKASLGVGLFAGATAGYQAFTNSPDDDNTRLQETIGLGVTGGVAGAMAVHGFAKTPDIMKAAYKSGKIVNGMARSKSIASMATKFAVKDVSRAGHAIARELSPSRIKAGWNMIPAKGVILPVLLAAGLFAASYNPSQEQMEAEAQPDGMGGYTPVPVGTGTAARSRAMNASGDLVFGMHRGRH